MSQAETNPIEAYLLSSFLGPLLRQEGWTDLTYNGESFFVEANQGGRRKLDLEAGIPQVGALLRQVANMAERQFSYQSPILDVSFGHYRLCATFLSLTRVRDKKSYSFALRKESEGSVIQSGSPFFPGESESILLSALAKRDSIVIGGETGSGKTELQKYLLIHMAPSTRVIVIDNVDELEQVRGNGQLDLTSWLVDENTPAGSFSALVKSSLRFDPDYLLLAEARGGEMWEGLCCAMSGHPLLITLHSSTLENMPSRIARLAQMKGSQMVYDDLLCDVKESFQTFVLVGKHLENGMMKRQVEEIGRLEGGEMKILFSARKGGEA